jgi:hypothetical protein
MDIVIAVLGCKNPAAALALAVLLFSAGADELSSSASPLPPLKLCIDLSLFGDDGQGGKVIILICPCFPLRCI